jgi:hypothetical protein
MFTAIIWYAVPVHVASAALGPGTACMFPNPMG